ncbi:MAG: DUF4430 domain-containing protein [Patescibacteria group bacterium]
MKKILLLSGALVVMALGYNWFATKKSANDIPNLQVEQKQTINATLNLEANGQARSFSGNIENGKSAADFVILLTEKNNLQLKTKEYTGMGILVEGVNGVENNNDEKKYWMFYVNGQMSQVGLSQYIVKNADKISLKYEKSNF